MPKKKDDAVPLPKEEIIEKNWMIIEIDYSNKIVLPVAQGLEFVRSMEVGYTFKDPYQGKEEIMPIDLKLNTRIISSEAFREFRRNYILGVNDVSDTDTNT